MRTSTIRRALTALAAAGVLAATTTGEAHAFLPDPIRLTDSEIDFGDGTWLLGAPIGTGAIWWSVVDGFYTPHLVGTLHLDNADGMYARMHIDYYDGGGSLIETNHGGIVEANDNKHHSWSVDLWPDHQYQIVQARVCTELSNDGASFWQVDCTGRLYM